MPKRRKKKIPPVIHASPGPLPARLAPQFDSLLLVFSDASQKRHGGIAAVLFETADSEALIETRTVALVGSNELELQATLFALEQARHHFPGRALALFSDNHDAVVRLNRYKTAGAAQDPELHRRLNSLTLDDARIHWIKGHATCRGNLMADEHAAQAAA